MPRRPDARAEQAEHLLLQFGPEVDEHVAAHDQLKLVERTIRHEIVLGEDGLRSEHRIEAGDVAVGAVVLRERLAPAAAQVVLGVELHPLQRERARPRALQRRLVDVGRVDPRAVEQALLVQGDRHRVDLLARRAAGVPDADERIGPQQREHVLAQRPVKARVAEHLGDVDRQVAQQAVHARRVVQDALLQAGDRLQPLAVDAMPHAPAQRRERVAAEVVAVGALDGLQQQLDLQALARLMTVADHPYSHTRMSEMSCSMSTGLVM